MSRARLVITAVVVEGRSVAEVAATYGVARSWLYKLLARYRTEGDAAFEPRSRRPRTSPNATAPAVVDLVVRLRKELTELGTDAGPHTIAWHLQHHHQTQVSTATISRILSRAGQVTPDPSKRPKAALRRFAAEQPNETWQTDFTHWRLTGVRDVEILNILDDHSRYLLACVAYPTVTGKAVKALFEKTIAAQGIPASVLSDNGLVFTTRFAGGKGGRNGLETLLATHGITEELIPEPPADLRQGRAFPPDPQTMAGGPTPRRDNPGPPGPARRVPRLLQPPPAPPWHRPTRPGRRLRSATQSHPVRARHTSPRPRPQGRHRRHRQGHPALPRAPLQDRHRANPRPNPHPAPRPRPPDPDHRPRHRRTTPRTHPGPHQALPRNRPPTRPPKATRVNPTWVHPVSYVLPHHRGGPAGVLFQTDILDKSQRLGCHLSRLVPHELLNVGSARLLRRCQRRMWKP